MVSTPKPYSKWVGHTLGARYKIDEFIAQGGMSAVFKASDPNLQRPVAIKFIHHHLSNDPQFVRRFEQEAASVAKLRHSNIVQVYDFNHDADAYYMVMEYVSGQTLKDKLGELSAANKLLPLADVINIATCICNAVAYAHEQGMIHRDLKPSNIMLPNNGQPVLMDFGLVKMVGEQGQTATGAVLGTAKYMSPEQARGERPDERSDIYALGVILYEMVAGQPPFDGDTTVPILLKHVNEPVPDIRKIQEDVPDELAQIIEKALAKSPAQRYQSAAHMSAALKLLMRLEQTLTPAADAQGTVSSRPRSRTTEFQASGGPALTLAASPAPAAAEVVKPKSSKKMFWISLVAMIGFVLLGATALFLYWFSPLLNNTQTVITETAPDLPSSEGMVRIAEAVYTVGLDVPDNDHAPRQNIELSEYWMDQYEVTNAQYAEFLASTNQAPPSTWTGGNYPADQDSFPVMGITWDQAKAYCAWAGKHLPSEAEWEIAARGAENRLYPWGDNQQAVKLPRTGTYKVGSKSTNQSPFGIFDMAGNVWEWVDQPYAPVTEGQRILRGGANDFLKDMAYRLSGDPAMPTMFASAGMRCAATKVNVIKNEVIATNVFYEDSFADPSSGWPILSEGVFFYGYHPPDFYHLEVGTTNNRTTVSHLPDFDDVTVEAEVLVNHTTSENGDFRYGLVLRRVSENEFYAFTISSRTGTWAILKSTAAGLEVLKHGPVNTLQGFAPAGFTPDKTDKLQVDANGSDFVFHINNQPIAQFSDADYPGGKVGFYVETFDESLAHVHFDTLVVRQVETDLVEILSTALFEDNFTDPNSGWPTEDEEGVPYRVGYHPPDYYHVEPRAADEHIAISLPQFYQDVTVDSAAFIDHTATETGDFRYGLVLRRVSDNEYYAFTVSPRTGIWQVIKSTSAGLEMLAEGEVNTLQGFAPAGFTPDKTDKLRVDALGSTFAFQINGEAVVQVSDADYADGAVGFYAETFDEPLMHAHYEDLTINEVDPAAIALAPTPEPTPEPPTPTLEPTVESTAEASPEPEAEPTLQPEVVAPEGMILIPAGYFLMGSSSGQALERPEHPVFLDAFYLDQYEVTNAQYRACIKERGCTQAGPNSATRNGYRDDIAFDDYPVVRVTWDQANAYCQWAGKHLPSEAQWEYAASGPENLTWPWGNTFDANLLAAGEVDTQPVDSYPDGISPLGIANMAGNVSEWVADDFDENFYVDSPATNPISLDVSAGRLFRGGSYGSTDGRLYTTSRRDGNIRTFSDADLGFRCALDASELTSSEERGILVAEFCEVYTTYKPDALCP